MPDTRTDEQREAEENRTAEEELSVKSAGILRKFLEADYDA